MKKKVFWIILFLYFICVIKFFVSNYSISYKIDDVLIFEKTGNDYFYVEIEFEDNIFNYMFYSGRKLFKKRVKDIKVKEIDDYICVKPVISGFESYFVCSDGEELVSYDLVASKDNVNSVNSNFKYFENLSDKEHIYIWKYDGFYYLNGNEYKSINIFDTDRYSNDLMIAIDNYLIFPKYDGNYLFTDFVILDMEDASYKFVESKYNINYDAYLVGIRKNNLYLFDNREEKLYEINFKKGKVKLVGDDRKGYLKYINGKKKSADKEEYTLDKITYFEKKELNYIVRKNYLYYGMNKNISFKFFDIDTINFVNMLDDNLYFIHNDDLYRFKNDESQIVLHYFEFNFNKNNNVFVYNK